MSTVAEVFSKLGLDVDEGGFSLASALIGGVRNGMVALGATAAGAAVALAGMVGSTVKTAGELSDLSARTGLSTDTLQELSYAGGQVGVSMDALVQGLTHVSRNASKAAEDGGATADAFRDLGVSLETPNGELRNADDLMLDAADRLAAMTNATERTAMAQRIFGKSGASLLPLLREGSAGIEKMRQRARDLGLVMSEDTVKAGDALGDELDTLGAAAKGLGFTIAGPLLAPLTELVSGVLAWVAANRKLIASRVEAGIKAIAGAFRLVVDVVAPFAKLVKALIVDTGAWKLALGVWALMLANQARVAVLNMITALGSLVASQGSLIAAQLVSAGVAALWTLAWVAGIILLLLLVEDLYQAFTGGDSVIGDFIAGPLSKFWDDVKFIAKDLGYVWDDFWDGLARKGRAVLDWIIEKGRSVARFLNPFADDPTATLSPAATSPAATAAAGGGATTEVSVSSPRVNAPITVNAAPGQDPVAVATETRNQFDEMWKAKMSENFVAVDQ